MLYIPVLQGYASVTYLEYHKTYPETYNWHPAGGVNTLKLWFCSQQLCALLWLSHRKVIQISSALFSPLAKQKKIYRSMEVIELSLHWWLWLVSILTAMFIPKLKESKKMDVDFERNESHGAVIQASTYI